MRLAIREIIHGSAEYEQEVRLRSKVLREPLGLRFTPEELSREAGDIHLGAFSEDTLLGCLILSPRPDRVMKMRQVAVDSSSQGLGIGKYLVLYSEERSRQLGFSTLELNARETAVSFYLGLGYEVYGEPFVEVTLPHRKMRKSLEI
jgi:predicted GNAT family N-acyltransferase